MRAELFRDLAGQWRMPRDPAGDIHAFNHGSAIRLGRQVIGNDLRIGLGVCIGEPDLALAFRAQLADRHRKGGKAIRPFARVFR